jgi:hypothetical protein
MGFDVGYRHHLVLSPLPADAATWQADLPLAREIGRDGVPL